MRPRRVVERRETAEIFSRAVDERALAVVTLQDATEWHSFKSRFLERDPRGRFIVLDYLSNGAEQPPPMSPGQYVGVSFRQRGRKLLFATIVEARGRFVLEKDRSVPALRYRWPESMTELQRRAYYRTPVPPGLSLFASLWAGGLAARTPAPRSEGNHRPGPLQVVTGNVVDLSCGGMMVRLHEPYTLPWAEGQTLGVELQLPDAATPLRVDGRYRGARGPVECGPSVAVQFIGLELGDSRNVLQRLAGAVHHIHRLTVETLR